MTCELCEKPGGVILWKDPHCRVVQVEEPGYPGFCRVIWNAHVKEMTDLGDEDRKHCMNIVFTVESVMRETLKPAKINLATLGNMVAHVHWHVIPRFADDPHFPQPVWGARQREGATMRNGLETLSMAIRKALEPA